MSPLKFGRRSRHDLTRSPTSQNQTLDNHQKTSMKTSLHVPTSTWRIFSDRCQNFGLEPERTLSHAVYLKMMNDKDAWEFGENLLNECILVRNLRIQDVPFTIGNNFFVDWRKSFPPKTTKETACISLCLKKWLKLSRDQAFRVDFMAKNGHILNI